MVDNFLQEKGLPNKFQLKADSNKVLTQKRQCHLGAKEIFLLSVAMQYLSTYGGLIKPHHAPCLT